MKHPGCKGFDLLGRRFGLLIIVEQIGSSRYGRLWRCKCDCGKEIIYSSASLTRSKTLSCGCAMREICRQNGIKVGQRLSIGQAARNACLSQYQKNAKIRNFLWALSNEEFDKLTTNDCFYCGAKPSIRYKRVNHRGSFISNGIDRKDNKQGYTSANTVSCCEKCNRMKGIISFNEFLNQIYKIYHFIFK